MRFSTIAIAAAATTVSAQRPTDTPICDYYTKALLKENTAKNQATLLTLLVNTVVIGNYTMPNVGVKVPGILAKGEVDGTEVNLLPYFSGELASTNTGGDKGERVNFLDGGAAAPLMKNMPAEDTTSKQYFLLTHLYQFFGSLLGCSMQGMPGYDNYGGAPSMYKVHKFMDLDNAQVTYFIQQVGMAAASFGVAKDDITVVAGALMGLFGERCAAATTAIKAQGPQLQAICIADNCPEAKNATCDSYDKAVKPTGSSAPNGTATATGTSAPSGTASGSATGTAAASGSAKPTGSSTPTSVPGSGAAAITGFSAAAVAAAIAAFVL